MRRNAYEHMDMVTYVMLQFHLSYLMAPIHITILILGSERQTSGPVLIGVMNTEMVPYYGVFSNM